MLLDILVPESEMDALRERVGESLASLNDREREVVRLYYEEGLSYREIGERIGVSRQRVSLIVKGLLGKLRKRPVRDWIIGGHPCVEDYKNRIGELEDKDMELSMRTYNVLVRHGYETVGDFIGISAGEIRGYQGMGEGSLRELCERLRDYNVYLE